MTSVEMVGSDTKGVRTPEVADAGAPRRSPRGLDAARLGRLCAWIAMVATWQLLAVAYERVPGIGDTVRFLTDEVAEGEFVSNFLPTIGRLAAGQGAAIVVGVVLGIAIGAARPLRALFGDLVLVGLALPAFVWSLLGALWFGFGWQAPVLAVFLSSLPFVSVNVTEGVMAVSPQLRQMSGAFGVPRWRRIRHLTLPAVLPNIVAGIRLSTVIAWNAVLITEWFGSTSGVGHRARYWYDANLFDGFVAWVVVFVGLIVVLDRVVLERLSRRLSRWRSPTGNDAAPAAAAV